MTLTTPTYTFRFPEGFDDRDEAEMTSKGFLTGSVLELPDGRRFPVTFFDPIRLAQDLEQAGQHGVSVVAEPGLLVVPEVTSDAIKVVLDELTRQRFFDPILCGTPSLASEAAPQGPDDSGMSS